MNKHILLNNVQVSNYKPVPMWKYNYKLLMNKLPTLPRHKILSFLGDSLPVK